MINLMSSRLIFATVVTSFVGLLGSSAIAFQEYPVAEAPRPVDLDDALVNPNQADAYPQIDEDLQVLMRGPMHEAFAESYLADPVPSPMIQQAPPADIAELPPEYKPDGNNVQWIPGYWAWDPSRDDFIWISGVWRDVPPNRQWVSGYWESSAEGYRWISGFWADESFQEPEYLPAPPPSLESGPSSQPIGENYFYVPGNWEYEVNQYRWRTGHWMPCTQNWIWIPARYVWTPRGFIYRCGYWDFDFVRRGAIFAPVCFNRPIYFRPGYCYSPSFVLRIDLGFLAHVFVRRNCNQYYFGNWYGQSGLGYQPWAVPQSHYRHYDPLLTYYSGQRNRNNLNVAIWIRNQQSRFKYHDELRPPLTYSNHDRHRADNQHGHLDRAANSTALVESYAARVKRSQVSSVKMPVDTDSNRQSNGKSNSKSNGQSNGKSYRQLSEQERKQEVFRRQVSRGGNERKTNSTIAQTQSAGSGNISEKSGRPLNRQNDEQERQILTELENGRKRESMPSGNTTQQPGGRRLQTQLEKNAADAFQQTQTRERQPNQSAKGPVDVKPKQEQLGRNQDRQRQQLAQQKLQQQQGQQRAQQLRESKERLRQQPVQQQIEAKPNQEQLGRNQDRQRQQQQLAQQTLQQGQQRAQQLRESKERLRQQPVQQQIEAKPKQEQLGRNQDRQRQQQQLTQQKLQQQQSQQRAQQLRESKDRPGQLPIQQQIEAKPNQEQLGRNQDRQRQQRFAQQQLQNQNQQLRIQQQQSQQQQGQPRAEQSRKLQDRLRQQQVQQQIDAKSKQDQLGRNQEQQRQRQLAQQKSQDQIQQQRRKQQQQQQLNQKRAEQMRKPQEAARQQSQTAQRQQQQKQKAEQQRNTLDRQRQQQQTQLRQAKLRQQPSISKAPDRSGPQQTRQNNSSGIRKSGGNLKKSK